MKPYRPRPDREKRLTSSVKAAEALVGLDLYPQPKGELLSICVWKATELDGKWNTRFCSRGALEADPDTKLNHEHVVERAKLVDRMLAGVTVDKVLKSAVACVVTVAEHKRLTERSRSDPGAIPACVGLPRWGMDGGERKLELFVSHLWVDHRQSLG